MSLQQEFEIITNPWAAKGNKDGRKKQRLKMQKFVSFAATRRARTFAQVGPKTVISYWKFLRSEKGLSHSTQTDYWRAIRELWRLLDKPGDPPLPRDPAIEGVQTQSVTCVFHAMADTIPC